MEDDKAKKEAIIKEANERAEKMIAGWNLEWGRILDAALKDFDKILYPVGSRKRREWEATRAEDQAKARVEKAKADKRLRLLKDTSASIGAAVTAKSIVSKLVKGFSTSPLHIQIAIGTLVAWSAYDVVQALNARKASVS